MNICVRLTKNKVLRKAHGKDPMTLLTFIDIPPCSFDNNLKSCVLNPHELQQPQIASNQEILTSQFAILSQVVIKAMT